jgi:hypothetical protein
MLGAGRIGLAVALETSSRDGRSSDAVTVKQQNVERTVRLLGNMIPKGLGNEPHLVPTSQKTFRISVTKMSWLMFRDEVKKVLPSHKQMFSIYQFTTCFGLGQAGGSRGNTQLVTDGHVSFASYNWDGQNGRAV